MLINYSKKKREQRGTLLITSLIVFLSGVLIATSIGLAETIKVRMGGMYPGMADTPILGYIRETKLFEKIAREKFGLDIEPVYLEFPNAPRELEAMWAGKIDFGDMAGFPTLNQIIMNAPIKLLNLYAGRVAFYVVVPHDSGIKSVEELKGKTVILRAGTEDQLFFNSVLEAALGTGRPEELGIKVVSQEVAMSFVPKGADAAITWEVPFLRGKAEGKIKSLVNSWGYKGTAYSPIFEEKTERVDFVKNAIFYPEGFLLHRGFWYVTNEFFEKHPNVAKAWVMAYQEALSAGKKMGASEFIKYGAPWWKGISEEDQLFILENDVLWLRGWIWPVKGDLDGLVWEAKKLAEWKTLKRPVSYEEFRAYLALDVLADVYDRTGGLGHPDLDEFTRGDTIDLRGYPVWLAKAWTE